MTPAEFKTARHALGLTAAGMARALRMQGVHAGRTIRRWESGEQAIPGYAALIVSLALDIPVVRRRIAGRAENH